MQTLGEALRLLAVIALGMFGGAMLTEACVLVPFWRSLPAQEFFAWYAANDQRLLNFFGPLTAVAALLSIGAALVSTWSRHPGARLAQVAAVLSIATVLMFPLYFQSANTSFSAASIAPVALPAELARWAAWHWARTAVSAVAFAAALMAVRR